MIKFHIKLYLVGESDYPVYFIVNAASPEHAIEITISKQKNESPRSVEAGDIIEIERTHSPLYKGFFILENKENKLLGTKVSKGEFDLWRKIMAKNPLRKLGIKATAESFFQKTPNNMLCLQ